MMGWYTDLHSDLQTEIEKQIGAKPRIEVEVDPDNQSIPLVGKMILFGVLRYLGRCFSSRDQGLITGLTT